MNKRIAVATLAILAAFVGVATATTSAQATSPQPGKTHQVKVSLGLDGKLSKQVDGKAVPMSAAAVADYRFTGTRFASPWICQNDYTDVNTPVNAAGNAFEAGTNPVGTVVFSYRNGGVTACTGDGYAQSQQVVYRLYQAADGRCGEVSGTAESPTSRQNPYYDQIWNSTVTININAYYAGCRNTAQRRANVASTLSGNAAGLAEWYNTTTSAIMNTYYEYTYSYAGAYDRNLLAALY